MQALLISWWRDIFFWLDSFSPTYFSVIVSWCVVVLSLTLTWLGSVNAITSFFSRSSPSTPSSSPSPPAPPPLATPPTPPPPTSFYLCTVFSTTFHVNSLSSSHRNKYDSPSVVIPHFLYSDKTWGLVNFSPLSDAACIRGYQVFTTLLVRGFWLWGYSGFPLKRLRL